MRRTAIAWRLYGPPSVASRRDTEVNSQGACNGLHRRVRTADEAASVFARTLGVVTGGPHAIGLGSIPEDPLPGRLFHWPAGWPQNRDKETLPEDTEADGSMVRLDCDRKVPALLDGGRCRHSSSPQTLSAAPCRRVAVGKAARMEDTTNGTHGASQTDSEERASQSSAMPGPQLAMAVPTRQQSISSFPVS
jgi:hypothetical protein